jgi:hypothetical protein
VSFDVSVPPGEAGYRTSTSILESSLGGSPAVSPCVQAGDGFAC